MYKVFIDHKPVVFISKTQIDPSFGVLEYDAGVHFPTEIQKQLTQCSIDRPLQIVCDDPKVRFKEYFRSYKKIKAAGGLVKRKQKYLLIKRHGMWDIPKGKIDRGETREEACLREIQEECGITGHRIEAYLGVTRHTMKDNGRNAIKKTYWFLLSYAGTKETFPQIDEGIKRTKWADWDELMAIRGRTFGSINQVLDILKRDYPNTINT